MMSGIYPVPEEGKFNLQQLKNRRAVDEET